jgi:hypothetical protein
VGQNIIILEFQGLSGADVKFKYCPSVAGPRIKQPLVIYWSKGNDVLSQI